MATPLWEEVDNMTNEFLTFRKYNDPALARELTGLLSEHQIAFTVEEDVLSFNPTFDFGKDADRDYLVKLQPHDFERAEALLDAHEAALINEVSTDHYLFSFTDQELLDILIKPDEWSNFDRLLAQKILTDRGVDAQAGYIEKLKNERLQAMKAPDKNGVGLVIAGYVMAFAGGFVGAFIGWSLAYGKKTLPNGEQVSFYSAKAQKHGKIILGIAIVIMVIVFILQFKLYQ